MPELPEVETVRRGLEMQIRGLAVESLTVGRPEVVAHPTAEAFCRGVSGRSFVRIDRRGSSCCLCWTTAAILFRICG